MFLRSPHEWCMASTYAAPRLRRASAGVFSLNVLDVEAENHHICHHHQHFVSGFLILVQPGRLDPSGGKKVAVFKQKDITGVAPPLDTVQLACRSTGCQGPDKRIDTPCD